MRFTVLSFPACGIRLHSHTKPVRRPPPCYSSLVQGRGAGSLFALLATLSAASCSTLAVARPGPSTRIAVLTPLDGVPVRTADVLWVKVPEEDLGPARADTLLALRGDFARTLRDRGLATVEIDLPALTGKPVDAARLAALGRMANADVIVHTELIAYGDIRRSWLWVLAAQGLVAGIGHGIVVAAATGHASYGWWAGAGEFALETVTWVGGALVGSRGIDPVLARITLVRASDGKVLARWTREGTRPFTRWFRRKGEPPRDLRLRAVADRLFERFAPRLLRRLARGDVAAPEPLASGRTGASR